MRHAAALSTHICFVLACGLGFTSTPIWSGEAENPSSVVLAANADDSAPDYRNENLERSEKGSGSADELREQLIPLAKKDFDAALRLIDAEYNTEEKRTMVKEAVLIALCQEKLDFIPKIPELLPEEPTPGSFASAGSKAQLKSICEGWVLKDFRAIIDYAEKLPPSALKQTLQCDIAVALPRINKFREAQQLLKEVPPDEIPTAVLVGVAFNFRENNDRALLFRWASTFHGKKAFFFLDEIARKYKDDTAALQELSTYVPYSEKRHILRRLGEAGGTAEVKSVTEWVKTLALSPDEQAEVLTGALTTAPAGELQSIYEAALFSHERETKMTAMHTYLDRFFPLEPQRAVEGAIAAPGDLHANAIYWLVTRWYQSDAETSFEWVHSLELGQDRDLALNAYATNLQTVNPHAAKTIANEIGDTALKEATLKAIQKP